MQPEVELPPPPEWGAWRENPSKTFLAREAAFDDTLETIRREGKLVRDRLFEAIEEAGGIQLQEGSKFRLQQVNGLTNLAGRGLDHHHSMHLH